MNNSFEEEDTYLELFTFTCKYCDYQTTNIDILDEHIVSHDEALLEDNLTKNGDSLEDTPLAHTNISIISPNSIIPPNTEKCRRGNIQIYKQSEDHPLTSCQKLVDINWKVKYEIERTISVCSYCRYTSNNNQDMNKHLKNHCKPVEGLLYACSECHYNTIRKSDMTKHLLVHVTDGRGPKYKCDYCSYSTIKKWCLQKHMLCHKQPNEVQMYSCSQCPYSTKRKSDLKKHTFTHLNCLNISGKGGLNNIIYRCSLCSYESNKKWCLQKHMFQHKKPEETEIFYCNKCTYFTNRRNSLKRHQLAHKQNCKVPRVTFDLYQPQSGATMESESGTNNTKISDSGYSNSCSNTNSQGSASSKSRHSGSNSSRSSGYGGAPNPGESVDSGHESNIKHNKDREHKRKKLRVLATVDIPNVATFPQELLPPADNLIQYLPPSNQTIKDLEPVPSPPPVEINISETVETIAKTSESLLTTIVSSVEPEIEPTPTEIEETVKQSSWIEIALSEKSFKNEIEREFPFETEKSSSQPDGGFCCVISIYDGVVLYTTPSLTSVLGFPKDVWLGCSFIDFVHPKDKEIFSNEITTSVSMPLVDSEGKLKDIKNYLYVCLRRYKGLLPCGISTMENQVSYQAFHLTVTIKQIDNSPETRLYNHRNGLYLFIIAVPVFSPYKVPGERRKFTTFGMRHTATCIFSHVDPDVVTNFGFLPQDMVGKSVFDFYHPEDMPFLKDIYKSVLKTCQINGSVFRSKPYRFLVQNGCFAMIETEWSCVLNPWSRRLEFVISLHQVLQGPLNPDVFDTASDEELKNIPEKIFKQGKVIQAEIVQMLTQELPRPSGVVKEEVSKRCKDVADFMESLMNTTISKLQIDVSQNFNPSISEKESVMLGEVSPHHDICDRKSSLETPPSYNQLNYNENIHRFFQSNPKTTITPEESNSASNVSMEIDGKNSQKCAAPTNNRKCLSPVQNSGASGCGSTGNLSSESNSNLECGTTSTYTSNDSYKPSHLTESILVRHNENMEKIMFQKHREERRDAKKSQQNLEKYANKMLKDEYANEYTHGKKRSGSHSRDGDRHKISKLNNQRSPHHFMEVNNIHHNNQKSTNMQNIQNPPLNMSSVGNVFQTGINNVNMRSPFSLPVSPIQNNPYPTGTLPVVFIPTLVQPRPIPTVEQQRYQVQYLPAGVLCNYNPIVLPSPVLYLQYHPSPLNPNGRHFGNNMISPKVNPGPSGSTAPGPSGNGSMPASDQQQFGTSVPRGLVPTPLYHRPSSQATSVKAEQGSRVGSIVSASVFNKTNDTSPRTKQPETSYRNNRMDEESSCYSSSYSSFLKADSCSGSNDDSASNSTNRTDYKMSKQQQKTYPLRKKDPPWVESVSVSSDMIYRYKVAVRDLEDVLKSDLNALKNI